MGMYDREYVRVGRRSDSGLGAFGFISVNSWIIIVSVAVFVLGKALSAGPLLRPVRVAVETTVPVPTGWQEKEQYFHPNGFPVEASPRRQPQRGATLFRQVFPKGADPSQGPVEAIGRARYVLMEPTEAYGHFSTWTMMRFQLWRFLSFQFLHSGPVHLLFNMMGLWFVGGLVEQYLGRKRYLAFYLVSGIFGAIAYLALNLLGFVLQDVLGVSGRIPGVLFNDVHTPLVGASAGVFGVLMAAAFIAPNAIVQVFFIIPMRLRTAVYLFTGLALANLVLGGSNAGGDAAHIGGAAAGYYFIRHSHLLRDFFDVFGDSRLKSGTRAFSARDRGGGRSRVGTDDAEIDRILGKVSAHGVQSLTKKDRNTLRNASERGS